MTQSRAILSAIAGYFGWVVTDALIKYGAQISLSPFTIMGVIGMTGAVCIFGWAFSQNKVRSLAMRPVPAQAIPALCTLGNSYLNVIALHHLPLTMFYVVVFTTPFAIALAVALTRHEKLTGFKMACLATGLAGVLVALLPEVNIGGDFIGYLAAFTSVMCFVIYTVTLSKVGEQVSQLGMLFYNALIIGAIGVVSSFTEIMSLKIGIFALMLGAGLINILANACYNKSLRHTSSTNVAALHYTQMIWGAAIGYVVWNERPGWSLIAGSIIIIASGLAVMRSVRGREVAPPVPPFA